jgi:uncharacterized protein YpiB (UPF0302 family)
LERNPRLLGSTIPQTGGSVKSKARRPVRVSDGCTTLDDLEDFVRHSVAGAKKDHLLKEAIKEARSKRDRERFEWCCKVIRSLTEENKGIPEGQEEKP